MAQRLHEDVCLKCGRQIETVEEFTIDHKEPWLHVSVDLFFDTSNIAMKFAGGILSVKDDVWPDFDVVITGSK